jgi:hypothetical protein
MVSSEPQPLTKVEGVGVIGCNDAGVRAVFDERLDVA